MSKGYTGTTDRELSTEEYQSKLFFYGVIACLVAFVLSIGVCTGNSQMDKAKDIEKAKAQYAPCSEAADPAKCIGQLKLMDACNNLNYGATPDCIRQAITTGGDK